MEFELFDAAQYRALNSEEFEKRGEDIRAELANADSKFTNEEMRSQVEAYNEEKERRAMVAQMRREERSAVARGDGGGTVVESRSNRPDVRVVRDEDPNDTEEYRRAFMKLVMTGREQRTDAYTLTTDVPTMIPTTYANRILETMDTYGEYYHRTTKTHMQGAVEYRIADLHPETHWVGEEEVSDVQKFTASGTVSFLYHEFESRVGQSWKQGIVTLDQFESKFVPAVSESNTKFLEHSMFRGTGVGQALGMLVDERVVAAPRIVEMTEAEFGDWKAWRSKVKTKMKKSYRKGIFMMNETSWNEYFETMADTTNAPIRSDYNPVTGDPVYNIMGKQCVTTEQDSIFPDFQTANAGDIVAMFGDLSEYCFNWQPDGALSIVRYTDYDKRKNKILAYGVCDGKALDVNSFVIIKKKASA